MIERFIHNDCSYDYLNIFCIHILPYELMVSLDFPFIQRLIFIFKD
jgi:hypothetical protein